MSVDTKLAREDAELSHIWPLTSKSWIKTLADEVDMLKAINKGLTAEADLAETNLRESEQEVERLRAEIDCMASDWAKADELQAAEDVKDDALLAAAERKMDPKLPTTVMQAMNINAELQEAIAACKEK